jgi:NitT/TauT family transport system substrate-binding protein
MEVHNQHRPEHVVFARRQWAKQILAGSLGVLCGSTSVNAQTDKARMVLAMDDVSSLVHLPVLLALQLGYFKAEGLLVDIVEQPVNVFATAANTGMLAWSVPFMQTLHGSRRDNMWCSVMQTGRTPQLALGVSKKTMPGFKNLKDFEGYRIGVLELDSFAHRCVEFMLFQAGVSQQRVSFVPLGSSLNAIQAIKNGLIDALCATDPLMTMLDKRAEINIVRNLRSVRETARVFSGVLPGNCVCVPTALLNKDPKSCQSLVNGVARALKWLRTAGPSDLLHTMTDSVFMPDRAIYLNAIDNLRDSFSVDGILSQEAYANAARIQNIWEPASASDRNASAVTFTNEFMLQAKKRYKM